VTLSLVTAGILASGGIGHAEDLRVPASLAVTNASAHGLSALRGRSALAAYPAPAGLARPAADEPAASVPASGLSDVVKGAIGCVMGGTAGTALAFAAGSQNTVNIVAGGLVPSVNRAALYVGLVGVVFGSFCAIGQSLTPIFTNEPAAPRPAPAPPPVNARHAAAGATIPQRMALQTGVLGAAVNSATRRIGATALASVPPANSAPGTAPPVRVAQQP
jgi:hypothetical protein